MEKRNLSKLQVRAEVLAVIHQLAAFQDASKEDKSKSLKRLFSIANTDYVLECLLKEFPKTSYENRQLVAQLLIEFGSLDKLEKPLWSIIKDPSVSDEIKDTANAILRNIGDHSDPNLYLTYLSNPDALIDKETERMLKLTSINIESQVDFLDFIFSLAGQEQYNLIDSLKLDYPSEYLAYILVPALYARPQEDVFNLIAETLGSTKSPEALAALENIFDTTTNENKKKHIKKSINMLKLSGIRSSEKDATYVPEPIADSEVFKCYASPIDGIGNQGIIISRKKKNNDIAMFSVVINDIQGVMDCFGFYEISEKDFLRIINKFQEGTTRVNISPEYCKYRLQEAEKTNHLLQLSIPYEYTAWKVLAYDISELDTSLELLTKDLVEPALTENLCKLYEVDDFNCWFMEDDDHPYVFGFFEDCICDVLENLNNTDAAVEKIETYLNSHIAANINNIFDSKWTNIYKNRLYNAAYLFKMHQELENAKLAATAAWALSEASDIKLEENCFILKLIRKSVVESFLRFQYKIDDSINCCKSLVNKDKINIYKTVISKLCDRWNV